MATAEHGRVASLVTAANPRKSSGSFISNFATIFSGQTACALVAIGIEVCYARLLGPTGRGQISLCMMAIGFAVLVGGIGCETPIIIWAADAERTPGEWIGAILFWGTIGCALASGLWAYVFWQWHPAFLAGFTAPLAVLVLPMIPVSVFFGYCMAMLTGLERFGVRARLALIGQVSGFVFFGGLVFLFGRKIEFAILAELIGLLITCAIAASQLRNVLGSFWRKRPRLESFGAALSLGLRGQISNMASFFTYRLDVFVVNYFLGPEQVGIYTLGVVISESLWQIPHAVAVALFPRTARTVEKGATEFTCHVIRQVLFIACLTGFGIAVISPFVVPLIFGARFSASVAVIWWILPGTVTLSLAKVMSSDLAARGKPEYSSFFATLSLGITIVLDLALIPRMGIQGAAVASSVAYLVDSVLLAVALKHELKISWKTLFLPSSLDFKVYQQTWTRAKILLRFATPSTSGGSPD